MELNFSATALHAISGERYGGFFSSIIFLYIYSQHLMRYVNLIIAYKRRGTVLRPSYTSMISIPSETK